MLDSLRLSVPSRFATMARFLIVGLTGILVNELVYVALVDRLAIWFVLAAILSTEASTTWNFLGNELWAFSGRRFAGSMLVRYVAYAAMNNGLLLLRVPMLWLLSDIGHLSAAYSNLVALAALFVLRFAVSDGFVWRRKSSSPFDAPVANGRSDAQEFRYDIGGLIRLDSDAELPELAYFRTALTTEPDIRIRMRRVGAFPAARIRLRRDGERVTYREHLGVFGADFNVTMGTPIEIDASPLLAFSRHVLYTNVVEALLRFVLVSKGYVLLHSAGMEVEGKATLLSAQTDTGKTSTVINLIRERGWGFISDDMAIIDPAGRVLTFPKPMTLSYHTMTRAVDADTLSPKKRMQLQVQSRVHSKSGRTVGKGLGSLNVPIMSINSVLQIMVPPPKYHITSLLPTRITPEAPIANVFLMERGEPVQERVPLEAAIDQLIENTDDAYGFPPFATLAPQLVIGGMDYQQLRARERELLTTAMGNVNIWRLRVRGHEWNELLPRLILGEEREPVGIPIETQDREPVGIPILPERREPLGATLASPLSTPLSTPLVAEVRPTYDMNPAHGPSVALAHSLDADGRQTSPGSIAYSVADSSRSWPRGHAGPGSPSGGGADGPPRGPLTRAEAIFVPRSVARPVALAEAMALPAYRSLGPTQGLRLPSFGRLTFESVVTEVRANARLWLALVGIMAVGTFVRLWAIAAVGFNNDEAVYAGQAAALAGDTVDTGLFAIFRAHPLLVQFLFSLPYRVFGVNDVTPRLVAVMFGLAGVGLAYLTGSLLYGRRAGLIAAAVLAVMPYAVIVSRQALLDGPETTLFLLTIYLLARYSRDDEGRWLYAAAFSAGLTVLAKETAVLLVPVVIAYLLLTPQIRVSIRRAIVAVALFLVAVSPYPAAIVIGKGTGAAQSYLMWELLRQPNHPWTFYADVLPGAMGPLIVAAAVVGLVLAIRRGRWQDRLLIAWLGVPIAFFEVWPVKGYQYLLPIAPAVAILAGMSLDRLMRSAERFAAAEPRAARAGSFEPTRLGADENQAPPATDTSWVRLRIPRWVAVPISGAVLALTLGSIAIPTVLGAGSSSMASSLAGTGGMPGGRDVGNWIKDNVPQGAAFLTEGPTLANIVEFYGQRRAYGLSVSPNPLRRNPSYDPIVNPDRSLQLSKVQYIATDIWSAERSPFFDKLLRSYLTRYHGVLVYQQTAVVQDASGNMSPQVVIQVYEVRP